MLNLLLCPRCAERVALLFISLGAFFISVSPTITAISFLLCVITIWTNGDVITKWNIVKKNPVTYWILAFMILVFIGITYSSGSRHEILRTLNQDAKFLFLPLLIPLFYQSNKNQKIVLYAFISGVVFLVIMSFFKVFKHPIFYNYNKFDPANAFNNHIQTSLEVALAVFILAHEFFNNKKMMARVTLIILIVTFSYYLLFYNNGRSGLLLFVILCLMFFLQRFSIKITIPILVSFIICLLLLYHDSTHFRGIISTMRQHTSLVLHKNNSAAQTSEGLRISFWSHSAKLIKTRPVFGYGTGSFIKEYQRFAGQAPMTDNPHNEYLNFGVQYGVIGIIYLIAFFLYLLYLTRKMPPEFKFIAQGIVVSYIIGCLFNSWMMDAMLGYIFILLVALVFAKLPDALLCQWNYFPKFNRLQSP